jgi:hypothetical protein
MRTLIMIIGGFVLWASCLGIAKFVAGSSASSTTMATASFVAIWFVIAAANMYVGVTQAGYSFLEELPIFLLIFSLPAVAAVLVKSKRL